jgi:hypothetical protein
MQAYASKVTHVTAGQWNGDDDEPLVHELRDAGWKIVFQQPETPDMEVWEWDDEQARTIPTPPRMLIIGPYRGQLWHLDAGRWLTYREGDGDFRTWGDKDLNGHWEPDAKLGDMGLPTPTLLHLDKHEAPAEAEVESAA